MATFIVGFILAILLLVSIGFIIKDHNHNKANGGGCGCGCSGCHSSACATMYEK